MSNDNKPTHGVVIPAEEVLALAVEAEQKIRDAKRDGEDADGVHISLWPSRKDGKAKLEHAGRGVRVYERQRETPEGPFY